VALWRSLPAPHRRWIAQNALLVTALINFLVNGVIAWLSIRGQADVPLWAPPLAETSTVTDTLGTLFVLPFITGLLCTVAVRRERENGELVPLRRTPPHDRRLALLPPPGLRRSVAFGAAAFVLLAPPVTMGLVAIDFGTLAPGSFIAYKVSFAVCLGLVVTPLIALCAMTDPPVR
jgi:hypothetical protein